MSMKDYRDGMQSIRDIYNEYGKPDSLYWESEYKRCTSERLYWVKMGDTMLADWYDGRAEQILVILRQRENRSCYRPWLHK